MMVHYRVRPAALLLALPVPILLAIILGAGCGLWVAALNVEYRDVRVVIPFVLQIGMYVTPVVYPLTAIPARYRPLAALNPMTGIVQTFRAAVFGLPVPAEALGWSAVVALVVAVSGAFYFRRMERLFADIL
jgi:lipopolysaccharide transport system permease protein